MENSGRNPVPIELVKKRREYAVELCRSGLSYATVLAKVNELDAKNGWGEISLRTLYRDVAVFYQEQSARSRSEIDQVRYLRQNHLAAMEATIELGRINIAQKDVSNAWRPGERAKAIESLFRMQKDMAQVNGWDFSKATFLARAGLQPMGPKSEVDIYDEASEYLIENPDAGKAVVEAMDDAIRRICKNEGPEGLLAMLPENKSG